jgi:protein-arginine kinase activator protein McsA
MKCDRCNRAATVHVTEVRLGRKLDKHLCEQCAAASEGLAQPGATSAGGSDEWFAGVESRI